MTIEEIFKTINNRLIEGEMVHAQMAEFWDFFGYLNGFKRQQEYRMFSEILDRRKLNRWFINHYNTLIPEDLPENPSIIPPAFTTQTRDTLNGNAKSYIKAGIEKWYTWEKDTLALYQTLYREAMYIDDVEGAMYIEKLIDGVSEEYTKVCRLWLKCKALDYEVPQIIDFQDEMHKYYKKKCAKLRIKL